MVTAKRTRSVTRSGAFRSTLLGMALLLPPAQQSHAGFPSFPGTLRVRSLLELRNEGLVRQHWDLSCGAAAVATLLTYQLGDPVTEREAAAGMLRASDIRLVKARLGFSLLDLKNFAMSRGLVATGYGNLSLQDMLKMAPIIVPIRVRNFGHFVVVRGQTEGQILIADPAFGNRLLTPQAFEKAWTSRIGFVITRRDEPHPPNRMGIPASLTHSPSGPALRAAVAGLRPKG
jgi:uncharacterized protein